MNYQIFSKILEWAISNNIEVKFFRENHRQHYRMSSSIRFLKITLTQALLNQYSFIVEIGDKDSEEVIKEQIKLAADSFNIKEPTL